MTTNPYAAADKIREITGTVTLVDGSTHEFTINADLRMSYGAANSILGSTSEELDGIREFLMDNDYLANEVELEDYDNRDVEPDPDRDVDL